MKSLPLFTISTFLLLAFPTFSCDPIPLRQEEIALSYSYCETESDCEGNFMICLDNRCVCDEDEGLLQSVNSSVNSVSRSPSACKSISYVGEPCDNFTHICSAHSSCGSDGLCQCDSEFELDNQSGECRKPFGAECDDKTVLCNVEKFLGCVQGRCACFSESETQYDEFKGTCVGKLGSHCELVSFTDIQLGCGKNAECVQISEHDEYSGVCKCPIGFYQEKEGNHCLPIFQRKCESSRDCGDEQTPLAYRYECSETKVCGCGAGLLPELHSNGEIANASEAVQCVLQVEADCSNPNFSCVRNSACTASDKSPSTPKCQCLEDFLPTKDGSCQLAHGATNCSSTLKCHEESGLICNAEIDNGKCECKFGLIYDPNLDLCVAKIGTSCGPNSKLPCTKNATCDPFSFKCKCEETFHLQENGTCQAGFGTKCDPNLDQCPAELGMTCGQELRRCQCKEQEGKVYDAGSGSCRLKVGHPCDSVKNPKDRCVSTAFCGTGKKCQCFDGFQPTGNGTCKRMQGHRESCGESGIGVCNTLEGLICTNGTCNCKDNEKFNLKLGLCETPKVPIKYGIEASTITSLPAEDENDNQTEKYTETVTVSTAASEKEQKMKCSKSLVSWVCDYYLYIFVGTLAIVGVMGFLTLRRCRAISKRKRNVFAM